MYTRINKFLAERGVCSRRAADALVEAGEVTVNGVVVENGAKVSDSDDVRVRGIQVGAKESYVYLALNKPVGVITSVDPRRNNTVRKLIPLSERVFPVGRLDVASSGLLLMTNDGALSERITHPRYHHEKEYEVKVDHPFDDVFLEAMSSGVSLEDGVTKPARVEPMGMDQFKIILTEGKNRQIRRMCEALGYDVLKLKRTRVVNVHLGKLPQGSWRPLTAQEVKTLKHLTGLSG